MRDVIITMNALGPHASCGVLKNWGILTRVLERTILHRRLGCLSSWLPADDTGRDSTTSLLLPATLSARSSFR